MLIRLWLLYILPLGYARVEFRDFECCLLLLIVIALVLLLLHSVTYRYMWILSVVAK